MMFFLSLTHPSAPYTHSHITTHTHIHTHTHTHTTHTLITLSKLILPEKADKKQLKLVCRSVRMCAHARTHTHTLIHTHTHTHSHPKPIYFFSLKLSSSCCCGKPFEFSPFQVHSADKIVFLLLTLHVT